ncbi:MAG: hypothetical protein ACI4XW_10525 [Candidatus Spyradocola sp.]
MPYVSTMEIYQDGLKQGYGTPMFNCINYEMIRWAIETGIYLIQVFFLTYLDF